MENNKNTNPQENTSQEEQLEQVAPTNETPQPEEAREDNAQATATASEVTTESSAGDTSHSEETANEQQATSQEKKKKQISFSATKIATMSFDQVVDAVGLLLQQEKLPKEKEIDQLQAAFIKKREEVQSDPARSGELQDLEVQALRLGDLVAAYHVRLKDFQEEQEKKLREAIEAKTKLCESLQELVGNSTDDFATITRKFREIESAWREIPRFSTPEVEELQDKYFALRDSFYDLKQLNDEFRELDFKKNLEAKERLIARAEELASVEDARQANRDVSTLHAEWKEIGPVAREIRDEIWERFTEASRVVRERFDAFLASQKDQEEQNLEQKKKLCESVEDINYDALTTVPKWNNKKLEVIAIQKQWKEVGHVPRSEANAIFNRFKAACDVFFSKKTIAFRQFFEEQEVNYSKKLALVEEAESLATSEEWNKTADRLKALQVEWNKVGFAGRKNRNLWQRFRKACDQFFQARKENNDQLRKESSELVSAKKELLAKATEMLEREPSEDATERKTFTEELFQLINAYKQSPKLPRNLVRRVNDKFYGTTNQIFKKWKLDRTSRELDGFSEKIEQLVSEGDRNQLRSEMTFNTRRRDRLQEELNNLMGNKELISSSSNWGDSMLRDIDKKINELEQDIALSEEKIAMLRKKLAELREQ